MGLSENINVSSNQNLKIYFIFSILTLIYAVSYFSISLSAQEIGEDVNRKLKPKEFATKGTIYFEKKSVKIKNSDLKRLQFVAEELLQNPKLIIYIRGHAYDGGSEKEEIAISEKRSVEVEKFFTLHGVSESQIRRLFYGNFRPLPQGLTTKDQSLLRRVEYQIITE